MTDESRKVWATGDISANSIVWPPYVPGAWQGKWLGTFTIRPPAGKEPSWLARWVSGWALGIEWRRIAP